MRNQNEKQRVDLANKLEEIATALKNDFIGPEYAEAKVVEAFIQVEWGNIRKTSNKI